MRATAGPKLAYDVRVRVSKLPIMAVLAVVLTGGCGHDSGIRTSISSMAGPSSTLNLSGTWSGTSNDTAGPLLMTWQVTQDNRNVTGTVTATTPVGLPVYTGGTVTATLAGTVLTFAVTIPRGSIADAPDCTVSFSGTAPDVTDTSLAGTYTGSDSCLGDLLNGRLTLLKQ